MTISVFGFSDTCFYLDICKVSTKLKRCLIKILKKKGPRSESWGTPIKTLCYNKFALRMTFKGFKQMLQNFFFRADVFFTFNDLLKFVKYLYNIILVQVLLSSL